MTNTAEVYDSRDIVERFLHEKLEDKGITWEFHLPSQHSGRTLPSSPSSTTSAPSSSHAGSVNPRRRVSASSSGEEGGSPEDSPVAWRPQYGAPSWGRRSRPRLQAVLQHRGSELRRIYQQDLSQVSAHLLRLSAGAARASLRAISGELFGNGVNWGRVLTMLEFGATLCVDGALEGASWSADDVAAWLVESLDGPVLRDWIQDNGGWDAFVEQYDPARPPEGCWSVRKVVGLVVLGAAGITLGALFTQK
ncbi:apoptosis regulator Bcl-2 [Gadus morhua]|uniref:Apoptosis regulator Bcl-2-like n=1 Tax=Gadus morhua TaxID=8049 RepID=A0A8C5CAK2_GADMO|nr:apoptosis regulator Bcl-2-like [Gadus morhua]